jgi:hypothetical protein
MLSFYDLEQAKDTCFQQFFNIVLEVLARAISQEKEVEGMLLLFAADMILYIESPQNSTKETVRNNKLIQQSCRIQNQQIK